MKRCLHVGCGPAGRGDTHHSFHGEEWEHVRLDIDEKVKPDIVGDIRTLDGVETESFEGVFSSHNLEHLHYFDVYKAIESFYRVMKDRAVLIIVVPDFQRACSMVSMGDGLSKMYDSPAGPIAPLDVIFGHRGMTYENQYMQHRCGFTQEWLQQLLVDRLFHSVDVVRSNFDLWAFARKTVNS